MKYFVLFINLFIFTFIHSYGQQMNVASFRLLESDLDAKQNFPERDQNGNLCAIIKVVTTQTGFAFDNGTLGITKTKQQIGEVWVYVPFGTKRLTIQHASLGLIRDYLIPEKIEQGRVYELVLTTGRVVTQVLDEGPKQQWLSITTIPEGATVYLNDELVGMTPFNKKLDAGIYSYRLELANYQNYAGKIEVNLKQKAIVEIPLKSTLGYAYITTSPESGAKITIDAKPLTNTSPTYSMPLSAGIHTIMAIKNLYKPVSQTVTIIEGDTINVDIAMPVNFANVNITAPAMTDILVDGVKKGTGSWQGRIEPGQHSFEAKKDNFISDRQSLNLEAGQEYPINLNPIARTGSLDVITSPMKAKIRLNGNLTDSEGKSYGETPNTIANLLIGEYTVSLEKEGYGALTKTVVINEGQTTEIDVMLPKGTPVTLNTEPSGASISVDNVSVGTSPASVSLDYGSHSITASKDGYTNYSGTFIVESGKTSYNFSLTSVGEKVNISSYPSGAEVTVDGKVVGTTPINDLMLSYGSHSVKLSLQGYNDLDKTIILQTGKYNDTYYSYPLYESSRSRKSEPKDDFVDEPKSDDNNKGYKGMNRSTKDYYKGIGSTAIMYGYYQTVFQNDGFDKMIENEDIDIAYGQAISMKFFSGYPFFFDMTWFSSRYNINKLDILTGVLNSSDNFNSGSLPGVLDESVLDTISFMHHGIEMSMGLALFNITKHFITYAGVGYQFSRLAIGRTMYDYLDIVADNPDETWDDYLYSAKSTSSAVWKFGGSLNYGHIQFFTEFKRSFANKDVKNKQFYLGLALAF